MEVIRDLNKSSFGSVKRSNSLSRKNGSRESKLFEKFTVREQRNWAVSEGRCSFKRVLSFLRREVIISMSDGMIQKRRCHCCCTRERLHGKRVPSEQERARAGQMGHPGGSSF